MLAICPNHQKWTERRADRVSCEPHSTNAKCSQVNLTAASSRGLCCQYTLIRFTLKPNACLKLAYVGQMECMVVGESVLHIQIPHLTPKRRTLYKHYNSLRVSLEARVDSKLMTCWSKDTATSQHWKGVLTMMTLLELLAHMQSSCSLNDPRCSMPQAPIA